jgi:hypothetical protein
VRRAAFLITDYLPSAIYDGDGLTACFRVENTEAVVAEYELNSRLYNASGVELKLQPQKISAAPNSFASATVDIDANRVARVRFELKRSGESEPLAQGGAVLLRDSDPWPHTKILKGRIAVADSGDALVFVVQKKRVQEERTFAPVKWIFGQSTTAGTPREGSSLVFVPGAWNLGIASAVSLEAPPQDGTTPILNVVNQILTTIKDAPEVNRLALLLPADDLDLATDARSYRVALDALLARLQKANVNSVLLIAPFKYGCNETHRKTLWKEVHATAALYNAKVADPADWMAESMWRADPSVAGVYAPAPNARGQKMIAQALADWLPYVK